jgi:hypothetical protein
MIHVVLLGDSVFDNASYVPGGPSVLDWLRRSLPRDSRATLLAVDGACVANVSRQLARVPAEATHLIVSVGGNDALECAALVLHELAESYREVLSRLAEVRAEFARQYRRMVAEVAALEKPMALCTIYDAVPGLEEAERAGLCLFNDVILREAVCRRLPVIDLRAMCNEPSDFAAISPIEPSARGGAKIARAVARVAAAIEPRPEASRVFG